MANRFVLNETSYHGAGAVKEVVTEINARGFKKAFVASDPDLVKFGVTAKVTDLLDQAGIAYTLYSNIQPNPTIENVQSGVKAFAEAGADCIVAIGGGSSMDTAKAIGIINTNPEFADVRSLEGVAATKNPCTPILAVPTTAGTAAEVTVGGIPFTGLVYAQKLLSQITFQQLIGYRVLIVTEIGEFIIFCLQQQDIVEMY